MTKQEQIEEMAVIGCVRNPQAHTAEECAKCDFKQGRKKTIEQIIYRLNKGDERVRLDGGRVQKSVREKLFIKLLKNC